MKPNPPGTWLTIIVCTCILPIGLYVAAISIIGIQEVFEAESWPTTQGTIITSEKKSCGKNGSKVQSVEYEYTVNGAVLSGSRITLSPVCSYVGKDLAPQQKITVHYSNKNPSASVIYLEGQYLWHWIYLGVGIFLVIAIAAELTKPKIKKSYFPSLVSPYEKREAERLRIANLRMEEEIRERLSKRQL